MDLGLLTSGFDCLLQMPTGSGKTWLAEQAIGSILAQGSRAIYLTPLRALANELVSRWRERFAPFEVGVFTGDYGHAKAYPVPFERARLLVMTPERLDMCTRNWRTHWNWIPEVNLLVVDELHLLGEPGRGPRLEGAIMRIRRLNPFLQLVGLSATLGNRSELADWLGGVHFASDWRPIPIGWRCLRYQRATDKPGLLVEEVTRCVAEGGQSLAFAQSRRRAEALSRSLADAGISAGHHHAGLDAQERKRLEAAYRSGSIQALVSTGTLEMGLNLPARQVVLYDLQRFDGTEFVPLSVNTVWQRAGRAGRRGLDNEGEVILLASAWDRTAERYQSGNFERIVSNLSNRRQLAEQVLVEVASGLSRTRAQLDRSFQQSLAFHQGRLPDVDQIVEEMFDAGMLVATNNEPPRSESLKPTRLGRIAVRQMLAPATVLLFARTLSREPAPEVTFFDLLLLCAVAEDCEPRLPVDFEELENLSDRLTRERSHFLTGTIGEIQDLFGVAGRRLLSAIKTALIARAWTRRGSADSVGEEFGCYAFEVRRLSESCVRILTAATAALTPRESDEAINTDVFRLAVINDGVSTAERLKALTCMVGYGLDEQAVTLTALPGVGGTLARRLREDGISDIEELALSEVEDVARVRGISFNRAASWVARANELIKTHSAFAFRESGESLMSTAGDWPAQVEPYRLRRAMELTVGRRGDGFLVSGGLEPHRVVLPLGNAHCDCVDHQNGNTCKHVLATRLHCGDSELLALVASLRSDPHAGGLDLFKVWFEGGYG